MIKSFHCKGTRRLYLEGARPGWMPPDIERRAQRKLDMLAAPHDINDLRIPPSNRLEALEGDRAGQHSIRINDQWRLVFEWKERHAFEVAIVDDHED